MSKDFEEDVCFLCGSDAKSKEYNGCNAKVFVDCANELCGEYLITKGAMHKLESEKEKEKFSRWATSKKKIQDTKKILVISYDGDIEANTKLLKDVFLTEEEISSFGFK
jgi:hypothetical protein